MHRLLLFALTLALSASASASASAHAQTGPGVIHYMANADNYRISGAPNSTPVPIPDVPSPGDMYRPTDLKYDGRYRYLHKVTEGVMPVTGRNHGAYYLWDEGTGLNTKLTDFSGPLYAPTGGSMTRWSNDRADTFLSFWLEDPAAGTFYIVRSRVDPTIPPWGQTIVDAGADFVPFNEDDLLPGGRLEIVSVADRSISYVWAPTGNAFIYLETRLVNGGYRTWIRMHPVGDTPLGADPVLYDEAATNIRPFNPDISPATGLIVFDAETRIAGKNGSLTTTAPYGLVALAQSTPTGPLNPVWLIKETTTKAGLKGITTPTFSPDGTMLAFNAERISGGRLAAKGLYSMPVTPGAAVSTIREVGPTGPAFGIRRWTW